jgi:phytoene dehydrogenase-like protein
MGKLGRDLVKKAPMAIRTKYDAVIVGSGPNGLAAALTIAQKKRSVLVLEEKPTLGGGARTQELTLPGFRHDVCSAIHPLALASPFFRSVDLSDRGLEWIHSPVPLAHPLDNEGAVLLDRSINATAEGLGTDSRRYHKLYSSLLKDWRKLVDDLLKPLGVPKHPLALMRFGPKAIQSAKHLALGKFKTRRAQALFAGNAAHSILPLEHWSSAAFGLLLPTLGHAVGWPMARGGSQAIADSMANLLESLGCEMNLGKTVSSLNDLPDARAILFDVTPRQLARIAGSKLPSSYQKRLISHIHGPGVFKMDWALAGPIPWKDPACYLAGTLHLGGSLEEIASAESDVGKGIIPEKPFVLLSQPSLFDPSRAPEGMQTAWAYCHIPNGCPLDMSNAIEDQIERFAPGFRDSILSRHSMSTKDMESYNPNYVGGDIAGGSQSFEQIFIRPLGRWQPYSTPVKGIYICSSSMPPGAGVHGMCGHLAAKRALRDVL